MKHAPIGILDSGFGGLSIYRSVKQLLPHESYVYIGDHAYLPYGGKTDEQIRRRVSKLIMFLRTKHIKLLVVACNTATIAGIETYRAWFPDMPIIGVVPVVKTAAEISKRHAFAVLSTSFTAGSAYQKQLIHKFAPTSRVFNLGCPNLVSYVEQGILRGPAIDTELRHLLTPQILRTVDVVVLGCTHYPFLEEAIRAIVGAKVQVLDSGGAVARHVQRVLLHNGISSAEAHGSDVFYSTAKRAGLSMVASTLMHQTLTVHYADI